MIWLTWRQFRASALLTAAAVALLVGVLAATRSGLAHDYSAGLAACTGKPRGCDPFLRSFFDAHLTGLLVVTAVALAVPALIGLFWGAPLIARELEAGTLRLVWNQSISRSRWLAVKLGLTGLTATALAGLASLAVTWWAAPVDGAATRQFVRLAPMAFGTRGIVPVGYAAFAFVLGVAVGLLVRRTLPAMAITLAVFVAVQVAMPMLVRPHLMTPVRTTGAVTGNDIDTVQRSGDEGVLGLQAGVSDSRAWVLSGGPVDGSGKAIARLTVSDDVLQRCSPEKMPDRSLDCMAEDLAGRGIRKEVSYQPSDRFWTFQWIETGLYLALTAGLAGGCFWWLRRRAS